HSTSKQPKLLLSPGCTVCNSVDSTRWWSRSLLRRKPRVSAVPYTGTSRRGRIYGSAPMWSSWPCVNTMPRTCAARSTSQLMSGITRSTPSISCSGNIRPESTTMMSSAHEIAIMLRPISPRPPSATSVSLPPIALLLLKERQLIEVRRFRQDGHGGAANLYAPRLLLIEVAAHTRHVVTQCSQQARVVEYRSRMVERHVYAVAAP